MIFKFNNGQGAILCGRCGRILYEGERIPDDIKEAIRTGVIVQLPDIYCEEIGKKCPENLEFPE